MNLSQHVDFPVSANSTCCDFLCKSPGKWVSSGKNMFDFMKNYGYNVGK